MAVPSPLTPSAPGRDRLRPRRRHRRAGGLGAHQVGEHDDEHVVGLVSATEHLGELVECLVGVTGDVELAGAEGLHLERQRGESRQVGCRSRRLEVLGGDARVVSPGGEAPGAVGERPCDGARRRIVDHARRQGGHLVGASGDGGGGGQHRQHFGAPRDVGIGPSSSRRDPSCHTSLGRPSCTAANIGNSSR